MQLRSVCAVVSRLRSSTGAVIVVVVAAAAMPAVAQSADPPSREQELERAIGEASAAEIAALSQLGAATDRRLAAEAEMAALDLELVTAEAKVRIAEASAQEAAGQYFAVQYELDRAEQRLRAARSRSRASAGSWYMTAGDDHGLESLAGFVDDDFSDAGARSEYLEAVYDHDRSVTEAAEADSAALARLREQLDSAREAEDDAVRAAELARDALAVLREEQADRQADFARAEADEQRLVEQIRAQKSVYEDELDRLRVESGSIGDMLAARQAGQVRTPLRFAARPVPGVVVSEFGPRMHPILGYVRMHQGVDMDAPMGDPIVAVADGIVVWAGERGGYGNTVIVEHGNQFATLYAHQSKMAVAVGATVRGGETIGYIGSTGMSSGPHLHFEVRDLGVPVNPERYLAA